MNRQVFYNFMDYIQNLGSHEDVGTGALATMFYYCPKLVQSLLPSINKSLLKSSYFDKDGENYCIETGYSLGGKGYNFRPDVLICRDNGTEEFKKGDFIILIESKFYADLSQMQDYANFKKEKEAEGIEVITILISLRNFPENTFDINLKWQDVFNRISELSNQKKDYDSEKVIMDDLLPILRDYLYPAISHFERKDKLSPYRFLHDVKRWLELSDISIVRDCSLKVWDYPSSSKKIVRSYGLKDNDPISHIEYVTGRKFISCGVADNRKVVFYAEEEFSPDNIRIEFLGEVDTHKNDWVSDYHSLQSRIKDYISKEKKLPLKAA